jgi:hypothetical protein
MGILKNAIKCVTKLAATGQADKYLHYTVSCLQQIVYG